MKTPVPGQGFWDEVKPLDAALKGEEGRAVEAWVGGPHDAVALGQEFGLMIPSRLESMTSADLDRMAQPIRDLLRQTYGDRITVYRGEIPGSSQSHGRQNKLVSYTTDRAVAEHFTGAARKELPVFTDEEIAQAEKDLAEKGEGRLGAKIFRPSEWGGGYVDMFDRDGNHITDAESIRAYADSENAQRREYNDKRAAALKNVRKVRLPVDAVVWATDRFNQQEIIARAGQEKNAVTTAAAALKIPETQTPAHTSWAAVVAEEFQRVRLKAQRVLAKAERRRAALNAALERLDKAKPAEPSRGAALVPGAEARYRQRHAEWAGQHEAVSGAIARVDARRALIAEFAAEGAAGYPGRGERLAEHKAELRLPELAEAARIAREQQHKLRREAMRRALEQKKQRGAKARGGQKR
jgi:hypothetical protein